MKRFVPLSLLCVPVFLSNSHAADRLEAQTPAWSQRAPGHSTTPRPRIFSRNLMLVDGDPAKGTAVLWQSPDNGNQWFPEEKTTTVGMDVVTWNGGEVAFFAELESGSSSECAIWRSVPGSTQRVLSYVKLATTFRDRFVFQKGSALFLQSQEGLLRSLDGGITWQTVETRVGEAPQKPRLPIGEIYGDESLMSFVNGDSLWTSTDTGRTWLTSWYSRSKDLWGSEGAAVPGRSDLVLSNSNGGPIRARRIGSTWVVDSQVTGWPRDSAGLLQRCVSLQTWNDTLWASAGRDLLAWSPALDSWVRVQVDLPDLGQFLFLRKVGDDLWIFTDSWWGRRSRTKSFERIGDIQTSRRPGQIALGVLDGVLLSCGWDGCASSSDSGLTWKSANRGLEGTYVTAMYRAGAGILASTSDFGIRRWNKDRWEDFGSSGLPKSTATGRLPFLFGLAHHGDTLMVSPAWTSETWIKAGSADWNLLDSNGRRSVAWSGGGFWRVLGKGDTLLRQTNTGWEKLPTGIASPTPLDVEGLLVVTPQWGDTIAWKVGEDFHREWVRGGVANGQVAALHPSGLVVASGYGVTLFGAGKTYDIRIPGESSQAWIGAIQVMGNRIFVARADGLWSWVLQGEPTASILRTIPRAWKETPRGWQVEIRQPQAAQLTWFSPSGARMGSRSWSLQPGIHSLELPAGLGRMVIARLEVGSQPGKSRVFPSP